MARCFFMGHTFRAMQANIAGIPQPSVDTELAPVREALRAGAHARAHQMLAELEKRYPLSGLVRQERGNYLKAIGDQPSAMAAYRDAVDRNDALIDSWRELVPGYRSNGRLPDADHAARAIAKLTSVPAQLLAGSNLLNEGELDAAEDVVRSYLVRHGAHIEGMRLLAQIGIKREVLDDAELLLEKVLELAPDYHDVRYELATVLQTRRRHLPALLQAQHLLRISPQNRIWLQLYADACDGLGKYDEAQRIYQQLIQDDPDNVTLQMAIAHGLRMLRKTPEAVEIFRKVARLPRGMGEASLALANMKTYRFTDEELDYMRQAEAAADLANAERYHLCFAIGTALEHRKEYQTSFQYYQRGNALKRAEIVHKPELVERYRRLQEQVCTAEFFAARRGFGCPQPDPIFVLGMPRSGSTLIEQILSSHSKVEGTLELPELPRLVQQFRTRRESDPPKYPGILASLSPEEFRTLGEIYLEETRVYRGGAPGAARASAPRPFFIDKMLGNFRDIGFIHLILPNAKIIDARREPMACCFSNFKQLFISGQAFTYDLHELGHYYRNYVELMDHWDRALPGKVLRVRHEDVVADLEGSVRRMLEFCGLPFEPACLEFYKTERSVRTISAEQVRRPIDAQGVAQWRNFEPWLGPLKQALGPLATPPDPTH
jgi:tetratricopeptide (TPR) repeat protein